jgi:hypothetical protein
VYLMAVKISAVRREIKVLKKIFVHQTVVQPCTLVTIVFSSKFDAKINTA